MACPRCNGFLQWIDRTWEAQGELPGHWHCLNCSKDIFPGDHHIKEPLVPIEKKGVVEVKNKDYPKKNDIGAGMKTCRVCGPKPLEDFGRNRRTKDGLEGICKKCKVNYQKGLREKKKKEEQNGFKMPGMSGRRPRGDGKTIQTRTRPVLGSEGRDQDGEAKIRFISPDEIFRAVRLSHCEEACRKIVEVFAPDYELKLVLRGAVT
jgi:hypothetical protein